MTKLANLLLAQKSIVRVTGKVSIFLLRGEWGEDIEQLLGLNNGNRVWVSAACGQSCTVDQATLVLMEAAWLSLQN